MDADSIERLDIELALLSTTVSRARLHLQIGDLSLVRMELDEIEAEARTLKIGLPEQ